MIAVAGMLLGYFAFAWIPFVAFEFYTIHCVTTHDDWQLSCESNCYLRSVRVISLLSQSATAGQRKKFGVIYRDEL